MPRDFFGPCRHAMSIIICELHRARKASIILAAAIDMRAEAVQVRLTIWTAVELHDALRQMLSVPDFTGENEQTEQVAETSIC